MPAGGCSTPSAPSVGGVSHSPKEFSHAADIVHGANVLLGAVLAADAGR